MEYVEVTPKTAGSTYVILTNGDIIYKGLDRTHFEGQWFFTRKSTGFASRLPHATTYEEALEEYQTETGNCIV